MAGRDPLQDRGVLLAVRRAQVETGGMRQQLTLDEERLEQLEHRITRIERILEALLDIDLNSSRYQDVHVTNGML